MTTIDNPALSAAVKRLGGPKVVAGRLWPDKDPIHGSQHLCHCLNAKRKERLSSDEVANILTWTGDK